MYGKARVRFSGYHLQTTGKRLCLQTAVLQNGVSCARANHRPSVEAPTPPWAGADAALCALPTSSASVERRHNFSSFISVTVLWGMIHCSVSWTSVWEITRKPPDVYLWLFDTLLNAFRSIHSNYCTSASGYLTVLKYVKVSGWVILESYCNG